MCKTLIIPDCLNSGLRWRSKQGSCHNHVIIKDMTRNEIWNQLYLDGSDDQMTLTESFRALYELIFSLESSVADSAVRFER